MVGKTLLHYEILQKIGSGGMGEVYRARDTELHRNVAIKVLLPAWTSDRSRLQRFEREARTLASLEHPHIATVYGFHRDGDTSFLAMEMIDGEPLHSLIPDQGFSLPRLLEIGIPLADAISYAHERGVIHRDLKPANVMIDRRGRLRVLDFGLGKRLPAPTGAEEATLSLDNLVSVEGQFLGTPAYMAPEQITGDGVDARTDVFALGVVLYELATGSRPFRGKSTASVISAILREQPPLPTQIRPDLPPDLARVIRRCLEKRPERRLQTALDLRNELEDLKAGVRTVSEDPRDPRRTGLQEERMALTTEQVRSLAEPSPHMIGDTMTYLDNRRESDTLAILVPGIGEDQRAFLGVLELSPCRVAAVSLYGFGPDARFRTPIPYEDHNRLLVFLIEEIQRRVRPKRLLLVGFSSGSDQILEIVAGTEARIRPDAVVLAGPSVRIGPQSGVSAAYADITDDPDSILKTIRHVSTFANDLSQWLEVHQYLVQACEKFGTDMSALRTFAVGYRANVAGDWFFSRFRKLTERVETIRCLFSEDETEDGKHALDRHLRGNDLGDRFSGEMFVLHAAGRHGQLRMPDVLVPTIHEAIGKQD